MRTLYAAVLMAGAAVIAAPALAADMPYYPPVIEIPDVDYGYSGSFYLRGSAGLNLMWAPHVNHPSVVNGSALTRRSTILPTTTCARRWLTPIPR